MLTVENRVGEVVDPIAQNKYAGCGGEHEIQLYVPMAVEKEVDGGMLLEVILGVSHQVLVMFAHVVGVSAFFAFHAAVLGPTQSQLHAPARVYHGKEAAQQTTVEEATQASKSFVGIAQTIAMSQIEFLSHDFEGLGAAMDDDTTFLGEVVVAPPVVVARKEVHLHPSIGKLGEFAQETCVSFGHHMAKLVPIVEHIAQQVDGRRLVFDAVEEVHQPSLVHTPMGNGSRAQMGIGKEVDVFHIHRFCKRCQVQPSKG